MSRDRPFRTAHFLLRYSNSIKISEHISKESERKKSIAQYLHWMEIRLYVNSAMHSLSRYDGVPVKIRSWPNQYHKLASSACPSQRNGDNLIRNMCPQANSNRCEEKTPFILRKPQGCQIGNFRTSFFVTRRSQTDVAHPYFSLSKYISVSTELASGVGNTALPLQYIYLLVVYTD